MIWIEFAGGVGAGKSSLAAAFLQQIYQAGWPAVTAQQAVPLSCSRAMPILLNSNRAQTSRLNRLTGRAARRMLLGGWRLQFSAAHPALVWQVMRSESARRSLPPWHDRIIRGLFFEVGSWYTGFSAHLQPGEVVVLEEGLAQRAVNLFAWQPDGVDEPIVDAYLAHLPHVDLTVVVRAPLEACLARAVVRGLPIRLKNKDEASVRRFVEQSARVAGRIEPILRSKGRRVIEVSNHAGLEEATSDLMRLVSGSGLFPNDAWQTSAVDYQLAKDVTA